LSTYVSTYSGLLRLLIHKRRRLSRTSAIHHKVPVSQQATSFACVSFTVHCCLLLSCWPGFRVRQMSCI